MFKELLFQTNLNTELTYQKDNLNSTEIGFICNIFPQCSDII